MTVLVDSDVLIEVSRNRNRKLVERWLQLSRSEAPVFYSPVSAAELWVGARPREEELLRALFASMSCAVIDEETGARAGEYLRQFHGSHGVEVADALIAASAVQHGARLWTRNRKHFPMRDIQFD